MKKLLVLAALLVCAACVLSGCGKSKPTLHLYSWADYVSPELIQKFESLYDCRVVYDTFDSNEALLAKLQAGATGYDLIFPSHYVMDTLSKSNKIIPLDHSKLTILPHIDPACLANMPDSACKYCVPYTLSYTGIGYNKKVVTDFVPSWSMFARNNLQKRATLLDDKQEVLGAALLTLGLDPNSVKSDDLSKAAELIHTWLPNISKFENEQYKNGLASNEFYLVMGYSGDMLQIVAENPDLAFVIPQEGCLMCTDVMAIPTAAENKDLAYKFINFIYEPDNTVENIKFTGYLCPNKDAYDKLPAEIRNNPSIFIAPEIFAKSRFTANQEEHEAVLSQLWEDIKARQ